jgi:hypothetical protein
MYMSQTRNQLHFGKNYLRMPNEGQIQRDIRMVVEYLKNMTHRIRVTRMCLLHYSKQYRTKIRIRKDLRPTLAQLLAPV